MECMGSMRVSCGDFFAGWQTNTSIREVTDRAFARTAVLQPFLSLAGRRFFSVAAFALPLSSLLANREKRVLFSIDHLKY
jgi:hypothetical protein